jgi:hypothetical protein
MPVERWVPSWWAAHVLVRGGAARRDARAAVGEAVTLTGRQLRGRAVLPGWALRVLLEELRADLADEM